jgi:hypothetical protein
MTAAPLIYVYRPTENDPDRIGFAKASINQFGVAVIPSRLVKADFVEPADPNERRTVSDRPDYILEANRPFIVTENSELHSFIRHAQALFQTVKSSELRVDATGQIVSVEPAKAVVLPERDSSPGIVDRSDEESIFGAASNSSWDGIEVTESARLMKNESHGRYRPGNER